MKKILIILIALAFCTSAFSQFVATMEIKEPIKGLCSDKVYVLLGAFKGQKEAVCPLSNDSIVQRLKKEVTYLTDSISYNDKGMVNIIINCNGEVVKCEMDNKTRSQVLDQQIVKVFDSLGVWKQGTLKNKPIAKLLVAQGHEVVLHARNDMRALDAMKSVPKASQVVVGDLSRYII